MLEDQMVISCDTEEDAKTLMEIAEHEGFLWASGDKPTRFTYFSDEYGARYKFSVRNGAKRLWCAVVDQSGRHLDFDELRGTRSLGPICVEDLI